MIKIILLLLVGCVSAIVRADNDQIFVRSIGIMGGYGSASYNYDQNYDAGGATGETNSGGALSGGEFVLGAIFTARPGKYNDPEALAWYRYSMFLIYGHANGKVNGSTTTNLGTEDTSAPASTNGLDLGWSFHFLIKIPNEKFKLYVGPTLMANVSTLSMSQGNQSIVFGKTLSYLEKTNFSLMVGLDAGMIIRLTDVVDMELGYRYQQGVYNYSTSSYNNQIFNSQQAYITFSFF